MSAERADILKIDRDKPTASSATSGYAAVPREVTRREDLSGQAHKVISALLGLCYSDERHTRASVRQISTASGLPRRSVERALADLVRLGLIRRSHKMDRPGGVMTTTILCHPKEFILSNEPIINWRVISSTTSVQTPRQVGATPRQVGATPRQVGATRLTDSQQIPNRGGEEEAPAAPPPAGTPPPLDSRQQECIDIASQRWGACNGDYHVGQLLHEYPVDVVREAIDRHFDKVGPNLRPPLLRATCRGMLADGWKPEVIESAAKPPVSAKPREIIWGP